MAKNVRVYITEQFHMNKVVEIPDGVDDIYGYLEQQCNSGAIDAVEECDNFSRHIDYDMEDE